MAQRRNRRAGVEDLWFRRGESKTVENRTSRHGRGKRWRARWVDDQGRERTASFATETAAKQHVAAISSNLHRGEYVDPRSGAQTFGVLAQRFTAGRAVKQKTASGERSLLDSRILPRWENVQLAHIVESEIRTWLADMQREVSSSRARQAFILYRQILDLAVADKALSKNPARGVKAPRAKTSRDAVFLSVEQVHRIADVMPRTADATLARFLAFTGLRWGEAVAVTVDALDFTRHIVHVRRTYSEDGGKIITGVPKDHAARWVPFPPGLDEDLQALVKGRPGGADVFQTPAGGVLRSGNWIRCSNLDSDLCRSDHWLNVDLADWDVDAEACIFERLTGVLRDTDLHEVVLVTEVVDLEFKVLVGLWHQLYEWLNRFEIGRAHV